MQIRRNYKLINSLLQEEQDKGLETYCKSAKTKNERNLLKWNFADNSERIKVKKEDKDRTMLYTTRQERTLEDRKPEDERLSKLIKFNSKVNWKIKAKQRKNY